MDFNNSAPIYLQIVELLERDIISGKYPLGSKLPSVRDLSSIIKVNPNTLQKALTELENEGLIYTERTNGKYVTNNQQVIDSIKKKIADKLTKDYLNSMKALNYTEKEIKVFIGGNK